MAKGRGVGKTPERVVDLIQKAVAGKSQSAVARESGLALLTIQRYLQGIGEPSEESLQKLADYFNVSVPWLLGYHPWTYEEEQKARQMHDVFDPIYDDVRKENPNLSEEEFRREFEFLKIDGMREWGEELKEEMKKLVGMGLKYPLLFTVFLHIPPGDREGVIEALLLLKKINYKSDFFPTPPAAGED